MLIKFVIPLDRNGFIGDNWKKCSFPRKKGTPMNRQLITPARDDVPEVFRPLLDGAHIYDSSCSPQAQVWFIAKDVGYYLKRSAAGTLKKEAALTEFFHSRALGPRVLAYESLEYDWLLTARIPGEDCTFQAYLDDPARLCDTTAELLRMLHGSDFSGCPIPDRTAEYLAAAERNHRAGKFDMTLFSGEWSYSSPDAAWAVAEKYGPSLKSDALIHGDYCLPNIMLDHWRFSGFIDLDTGGVGDRHVDLFWGAWSLQFNLKTDAYKQRFLDAYGRADIDEDLFPVIAAIEVFG